MTETREHANIKPNLKHGKSVKYSFYETLSLVYVVDSSLRLSKFGGRIGLQMN